MNREDEGNNNSLPRPRILVAIVISSVFLVEAVIMNFFHEFAETAHGTMDAMILTAVLLPVLYFFIYRPLSRSVRSLKAFSRTLERQVRERTAELELSESLHRAVITSSVDAIFRINNEGAILMANPAAHRMFGYTSAELENKHISLLLPEGYETVLVEGVASPSNGWGVRAADVAAVTKSGGNLAVECTSSKCLVNGEISFVIAMRDVSERKRTEAELLSIMEAQPDILYVIDKRGALIKWNSALQELCGLTREQMMGRPAAEFVCEEDRPAVYAGIEEVLAKGSASIDVRFIKRDGTLVPHLCGGALWKNEEGEILGFIGVGKDISERKKAEDALRKSEQKFMRFFTMLPIAVGVVDKDGVITEFNSRFTDIFGYTVKDIPTIKEWWERAYPDESYRRWVLETWGNAVAKAAKEGTDIEPIEYKITCKNGAERFAMIGGIILDGDVLATFVDITERKRAEKALFESEARYRLISDASFEGIVINIEGKVVDCNTAFARMFGFTREEIIGKIPVDLSPPESHAIIMDHIRRESEEVYDVVARKKDGTLFHIEMRGRSTMYQGVKARITAMRDITERKRAERAIRESEERLRATFDNSEIGMAFVSTEGKFERINGAMCRMLGYEAHDLEGKSCQDVTHPDDRHIGLRWLQKVASGEAQKLQVEERFIRKDGSAIWGSAVASVIRDAQGKPMHIFSTIIDITLRKDAEKTIQLMSLFPKFNPAPVMRCDADGVILMANPSALEVVESKNLQGVKVQDVIPGIGGIDLARIIRDNSLVYFTATLNKGHFQFGIKGVAELGVLNIYGSDITELKRAADELRSSEENLRKAQEIAHVGNWNWDMVNNTLQWSEEIFRIFGVASQEFGATYDAFLSYVHPDDRAYVQQRVNEAISKKSRYDINHRIVTPDGSIRTVHEVGEVAYDETGLAVSMVGVVQDVTELKIAEKALYESENKYRALVEETSDWVWAVDENGVFTYSSPQVREITGYGADEILGKTPFGYSAPEEARRILEFFHATAATRKQFKSFVHTTIHKDGHEIVIEISGVPCFSAEGRFVGYRGINRDITKRKLIEDELHRAKDAAEEATRLKDKFISLVSHDLKTPLASMIGFLRLVRHDHTEPLSDGAKLILDRAMESGDAMVHLIEDLLTISRFKTGQLKLNRQFFDAEYLGAMMAANYAHLAVLKGIEMENKMPANYRIYGDKTLLTEAVQNLVTNAIKFCKSGDRITIAAAEGDMPGICVRDTGPGIKPNMLGDLFRFEKKTSTTGTAGETGTGFGLPLVKSIMDLHGGELKVDSVPGKGSTFSLHFPYVRPKILLVDDDRYSRYLQMRNLQALNADVLEAENGEDALDMIASVRPNLVITDIKMPVMDGLELLKRIKGASDTKDIPVIVISGEYGMEIRDTVYKFGGDDFVTKNRIDTVDFFPRIRRFIG